MNFHADVLPPVFRDFFKPVSSIHHYNTRLASKNSYYISKIRKTMANLISASKALKSGTQSKKTSSQKKETILRNY